VPLRLRRKVRYLLGGLTLRRAGFAPAGRQTEFRETIAFSLLRTGLACDNCERRTPGGCWYTVGECVEIMSKGLAR
jgi:hypothetical protein